MVSDKLGVVLDNLLARDSHPLEDLASLLEKLRCRCQELSDKTYQALQNLQNAQDALLKYRTYAVHLANCLWYTDGECTCGLSTLNETITSQKENEVHEC